MIYKKRADIHKAFELLESAIESKEAEIKQKLKQPEYPAMVNNLVANSFETVNSSVGKFEDALVKAQQYVELFAAQAQKALERNPKKFLGQVAVCSLGLGLILGSRWRNSRSRAKK